MTNPTPASTAPRQRLHPLTPLLRGGRLAVLAVAAISWQGYQDLGTRRWLAAVGLVAVAMLIGSAVSWWVTGYHVVGRELRIYEGLIWRRTRAIPVERLQAVELVRPLLARLCGLAELRLEVVGSAKTEAPLAFLPVADAVALRERLLALSTASAELPVASAPAAAMTSGVEATGVMDASVVDAGVVDAGVVDAMAPGRPDWPAPQRVIHVVASADLLLAQLLRPQWWFLPFAIAAPILYFAVEREMSLIAVASTVTAVIGAVSAPIRSLLADWRFTIAATPDGLRLRRGLLETRSQTVPVSRVQAVRLQWPLLWRGKGWVRAAMEIAGVSAASNRGPESGTLLPVGTVPTAARIVTETLPGFELTSIAVHPVPGRARWLAPIRRRVLGCQLTATTFVSRDGVLTRQLVIVPYGRIQSVRIRQGPLQRWLRLATVHVDTAGRGLVAVAPHRDQAEAVALATELAERSRAARRADRAGQVSR